MFFRCTLLLAAFLLTACAGEREPAYKPIQVSRQGQTECFEDVGQKVSAYMHNQLSTAQVEALWDCAIQAVGDYQLLTVGEGPNGAYTPQAIGHFIHRYFLKDRPLSDGLLISLMELKRLLLAGSTSSVSYEELSLLRRFLGELKTLSLQMQPDAPILFLRREKVQNDQELELAVRHLHQAMQPIVRWLQQNQQAYSFVQLGDLIRNARLWWGSSASQDDFFKNLEKALPLLPQAKTILVAGNTLGVGGDEWTEVFDRLIRAYGVFVAGHYAFQEELNTALQRDTIPYGLSSLSSLLFVSLNARPQQRIPAAEWKELFAKIQATGWLPLDFTDDSIFAFWRWFLARPLGSVSDGTLNVQHVQKLTQQAQVWKSLLNNVSTGQTDQSLDWRQFAQVYQSTPALQWDTLGRMLFERSIPGQWQTSNLRRLVWPFMLINWLKSSYVDANQLSISPVDVNLIVSELLPLLKNFGWLKTTKPTIGARLLREADTFMLVANGDGQLDLSEAVSYLSFVASSYRAADVWLTAADATCSKREAACVRQLPFANPQVLAGMPRLFDQLTKAHGQKFWRDYLAQAENTILGKSVQGSYGTGGLLQVWMLFEYVEAFLQRYDLDHTDWVDLSESQAAFTVFGPTLTQLLAPANVPPEEVLSFFTFMMKYGDTPFTMWGGGIAYNNWKWHRSNWSFQADHRILMGILYQLSRL